LKQDQYRYAYFSCLCFLLSDKGKDIKDTDSVGSRDIPPPSQPSRSASFTVSILRQGPKEQLLQAREILELGLKNVSQARQAVALTDGNSIADIGWVKVGTNILTISV
jgi:hypothetical protein